jgi:hypothetical protein
MKFTLIFLLLVSNLVFAQNSPVENKNEDIQGSIAQPTYEQKKYIKEAAKKATKKQKKAKKKSVK